MEKSKTDFAKNHLIELYNAHESMQTPFETDDVPVKQTDLQDLELIRVLSSHQSQRALHDPWL